MDLSLGSVGGPDEGVVDFSPGDVKLSEEITKSYYLDSKDKLDLLIKDNESIGKLITELKLRI